MIANTLITKLNNPVALLKINQRSATVISVIIVIACAYLLVEITWMLVPQADEKGLLVHKKNGSVNNRQAQQDSFRQLTSANIFGASQNATPGKQAKTPVTKLNLTLKGVLAAIPMEMASAIIAQGKSGKEEIYSVGDKLSGGVLIKEIRPEHVVLERSGRREILKLQKISGVNLNTNQAKVNSSSGRSTGKSARALSNIRNNILKSPTSFADYALPVIVKENGKQIGYRLQPQQKGELLAEMGLLPTDVVIQINGVKLDKPQNGINALRKLSTAKNLDIVVKRNGAEVPLSISVQ